MDVFKAFPNAIISGIWQISTCQRGGIVGNTFDDENAIGLDVIIDEGSATTISSAPNAAPLDADLLLYAKPDQLPTTNTNALITDYLLYNSEDNNYYAIVDASIGKNQETGEVEHIELTVKQTEVTL